MLVLYIFQVKSVGKHDLTELLQLKHHLYDALLWCTMLADDLIASPMDQMLFLSSILPIRYYCISGKLTSLVVLSIRVLFSMYLYAHWEAQHWLPWTIYTLGDGIFESNRNLSSDTAWCRSILLLKEDSSEVDSDTNVSLFESDLDSEDTNIQDA